MPRAGPLAGGRGAAVAALGLLLAACATAGTGRGSPTDTATTEEWRALAEPRPTPMADAPRLSFSGVDLTGASPWTLETAVPTELGLSELVVAGLLRRRDVQLVERRRFAAAVEAERAGTVRAPGAPEPGVSPGVELAAAATWVPLTAGQAVLEVRLTSSGTGSVERARRVPVPADADMIGAARVIVGVVLALLDELDRRPTWSDPVPEAAPSAYRASGLPDEALHSFLVGLAAEERWNWEAARRSYEAAVEAAAAGAGFPEAEAALARTARLRMGGTLGES